ncbi:MAG TPA: hypothetical protein VFF37_06625 [Streptomyces sp.]|nr:hypothetical protein [Streptomyces sp.]
MAEYDEDAVMAAVELAGRSGATDFTFGYVHDDVPIEEAGWYAHAQFRGARITAEDHRGPVEACEALARRLLTGAKCAHCQGLISLSSRGAFAWKSATLIDGTPWTAEQAAAARQCRWTRIGPHWKRGCEQATAPPRKPKPKKRRRRG